MRKEVFVFGSVGVPPVTEHNASVPFQPTAGGLHALAVRDFRDSDLTQADAAAGITAAQKQFQLGIGPGCTQASEAGDVLGQAIPPIRLMDVCSALDLDGGTDEGVRCCLESICDEDLSRPVNCLTALFPQIIVD